MNPEYANMEPTLREPPRSNPFVQAERTPAPITGGEVSPLLHHQFRALYPDFRFRLRAKGGEHLVIEFEDTEGGGEQFSIGKRVYKTDVLKPKHEVIKIDYATTLLALGPLLTASPEMDQEAYNETRRFLRNQAADRKQRLSEMARPEYLGPNAIPKERYFIRDVPISKPLLNAVFPGYVREGDRIPSTAPALVILQERIDIRPEENTSIHGTYPEWQEGLRGELTAREKHAYAEAHRLCIGEDVQVVEPNELWQLACHLYPGLSKISSRVRFDANLASSLRDTVHRVIAYIQGTGKMLDFAGVNNFVMVHDSRLNTWQVKAVDPLALPEETVLDLKAIVARIQNGEELPREMQHRAQNEMNTVRAVNALAVISGSKERLRIEGLDQIPAETWRCLFYPAHL